MHFCSSISLDGRLSLTEFLYSILGIQNVSLFLCILDGLCLCLNIAVGFNHNEHILM